MGSKKKEKIVRYLIRVEQPDILLIHETKKEENYFLHRTHKIWNKSVGIVSSIEDHHKILPPKMYPK